MFQKYLQKILKDILGQYIEEIDSKELSVGVWSGKIDIKNIRIKKNILQKHNLPIIIRHSSIKGLGLKIPWKNLFGSPLVITVESVLILCEFATDNISPEEKISIVTQLINITIKQVGQDLVQKGKQKSELKYKTGLIDKFTYKMLDNLYLSIKNIHVRFEQRKLSSNNTLGYSFGCSLESMEVYTVGPNNQKVFIDRSKLQTSENLLRKKLQMKNLSIYCNYGESEFITDINFSKSEKIMEQKLSRLIYSREKFNANINKNNYILIMNVSGIIDEDHRQEIIRYDISLNLQKLIVKLDKDVLNALLYFVYKLNRLNDEFKQTVVRRELTKEDDLIFRKYCNAFLFDFKSKEIWNSKDMDMFNSIITNFPSAVIVDKIKYIVVNQMSVTQLSKFFALKAQDLDKGLLEVSKQIKDIKEPKIKISLTVPQITLYLVNELSQSILQFNILGISILYHEKIINQNKVQYIDSAVSNISAINNNIYMISVDKEDKTKFISCQVEIANQSTTVDCKVSSFNFFYDFQTIFKINELFRLRQIQYKYKNVALEKINEIESKVNQKVINATSNTNLGIKLTINRPKIFVKEGKYNWNAQVSKIICQYSLEGQLKVKVEQFKVLSLSQHKELIFIEPVNLAIKAKTSTQLPQITINVTPIIVHLQYFLYNSLLNLQRYLFINKKNDIINKCSKSGEIFLKQNQWKKCYITLVDSHLYCWQNESQYPLFNIRLRLVNRVVRGNVEILSISDKKKIYEIAFKEVKQLNEWHKEFEKITLDNLQAKPNIEVRNSQPTSVRIYLQLQKIHAEIVHHKFNNGDMKFTEIIETKTLLEFSQIILKYENVIRTSNRDSKLQISIKTLSLNQNDQYFIFPTNITEPLVKTEVLFQQKGKNSPQTKVNIVVNSFSLHYKPEIILLILHFFNHIETSTQSSIKNYEQRLQQQNPNTILVQVNLQIRHLTVILFNSITNLPLAKVICQSIQIYLTSKYYEMIIEGKVKQLSLFDLTNYPNTIYSPSQIQKIVQRPIIQNALQQNCIYFKLQSLLEGNDKIVDNINAIATVTINNIKLNVSLQVILRIIDYINAQILGLVFFYEFYPQKQSDKYLKNGLGDLNYIKYVKEQKDVIIMKYLSKMGKQQIKKITQTSKPLFFTININNSILHFISNYANAQGFEFNVQNVFICNDYEFKQKTTNLGTIQIPYDLYSIQMNRITLNCIQNGQKYLISKLLKNQTMGIKFDIKFFSKQLEFKYIYSEQLQLCCQIDVDVTILNAKLNINENILACMLKILNNNISHEDGLIFLMHYQYILNNNPTQLQINIASDLLIFQMQLLGESEIILVQMGGFQFDYSNYTKQSIKSISNQYIIINYSKQPDPFTEVLTSRKIFGTISNRGTFYTQLAKQNQLISLANDTAFKYESKLNKESNSFESILSGREMMFIINMDFAIYAYKISMSLPEIPPIAKRYILKQQQIPKIQGQAKKQMQIKLDKILICSKVPHNDIILSALATVYINISEKQTLATIPDLEAFISNEQHIACSELAEMKKRTLLRPTHLKIIKNQDQTQIFLGKCFLKVSIHDIQRILSICEEMNQKYGRLVKLKIEAEVNKDFKNEVERHKDESANLLERNSIQEKIELKVAIQVVKTHSYNNIQEKNRYEKDIKQNNIDMEAILDTNKNLREYSAVSKIETSDIKVNLDTIEVMVVDDLNDLLTPIIYINLKIELNRHQKATVEFYADYFNLRNTYWQPMIEKNTIVIDYNCHLVVHSLGDKDFININVASNFVQNIIKILNHKELKSSRMVFTSHKVDKDEINSWIVINQLGQDIICEPVEGSTEKAVFIANGDAQTLGFLRKETVRQFKQKENEQIFVKLLLGEKLTIKRLKINEMGLKKLNVRGGASNMTIIRNLYVDLSKNIKYLNLSSEIIFQNKSNITIKLKLSEEDRYLHLLPNKSISLPYYCHLDGLLYAEQDEQNYNNSLANLEKLTKIIIGNKIFNVFSVSRKLKRYFTFLPLSKITNYLPYPITLHFQQKTCSSLYTSLELSSYEDQNLNFDYLYKPLDELLVSLWIENYHCTDFLPINSSLQIKDYQNNPLTIKCEIYKQATPMFHIAFMVAYIIRNETQAIFDVIIGNQLVRNIKKGEHFSCQKNQITLLLNGEKSETIYLTKRSSQFSIKNQIDEAGQLFKSESIYSMYKKKVEVDSPYSNNICFYISQILPMYVFTNEHASAIVIRQNGAGVGEYQLIPSKASQNIVWFLDGNGKRRPSSFRVTIENSAYDWSCLFNFQFIKNSYFILRSKFNYRDMKYCFLSIKKRKQIYQISFKQLTASEIPYLIKNNTCAYNILIDNIRVAIKPKEETYFCWDDPNTNQKIIKIRLVQIEEKRKDGKEEINYQIKVDSFQQLPIKSKNQNLDIEVINQINRQIYVFTDELRDEKKTTLSNTIDIKLPLRIALINNSSSPANHLLDLTTHLAINYMTYSSKTVANVELKQIQLDNQTKPLTYFPVVLSTDLKMRIQKAKYLQVQLMVNSIRINIEEDFVTDLTVFFAYIQSLTQYEDQFLILEQRPKEDTFFISKLILPKITVELEIQTKKFSIETIINLQKPEITSYPWKNFPYPISSIIINILSHLSISPWAIISSFGRGLTILLTEQETTRGFEGFFQQLIGGFSNTINGMLGMIVGHDIEKVDNFIDGLGKGFWALGTSLYEIIPNFEGDYSPINIIKGLGTSVVNLVFKPVTGILRMTLRISEGIKKTTKFEFGQSEKKFKNRFPIVFYQREQTFHQYNNAACELMNTLKRCMANELKYFYLIEMIPIDYKLRQERYCLVIGNDELILFNMRKEKIIWNTEIDRITNIEVNNFWTVRFNIRDVNGEYPQNGKNKLDVDTNSEEIANKIFSVIEKVKKVSSIEL